MQSIKPSLPSGLIPGITVATTSSISQEKNTNTKNGSASERNEPTKATLSGKSLMMSRLFHTNDINAKIAVETNVNDSSVVQRTNHFAYLNESDREIIEKAYEISSANGIDLQYVNALASDMTSYRQSGHWPPGKLMDLEGREITFSLTANDSKIADRLKTSDINSFDPGFMKQILNGYKPGRAVDFRFLEFIAGELSNPGSMKNTDIEQLKSPPTKIEFNTHISADADPNFAKNKSSNQNPLDAAIENSDPILKNNNKYSLLSSVLKIQEEQESTFNKKLLERNYGKNA